VTRCTDGGKIWHRGGDRRPLLHAKFHPHRCNDKGVRRQKQKFLLRFDQNVEYKHPAGAYPLRFSQNLQLLYTISGCVRCQKCGWICLRGYGVMGVLISGGLVSPKYSAPLAAKLCVRPPNVFQVKERARVPLSPCQVWWGSDFTRRRGGQKR